MKSATFFHRILRIGFVFFFVKFAAFVWANSPRVCLFMPPFYARIGGAAFLLLSFFAFAMIMHFFFLLFRTRFIHNNYNCLIKSFRTLN